MNTPHTSGISNNTMHGREKVHIRRGYEGLEGGVEVYLYSFFNLIARWGWLLKPHSGRFTAGRETRYSLSQRMGGRPGSVWTCAENLVITGIRSPDRSARSESLYQIR